MRNLLVFSLLLAGCPEPADDTSEPDLPSSVEQWSLDLATRGAVLDTDGTVAVAGMGETLTAFRTEDGATVASVEDDGNGRGSDHDGTTATFLQAGTGWTWGAPYDGSPVLVPSEDEVTGAWRWEGGTAWITRVPGYCGFHWSDGTDVQSQETPCGGIGDVAIDRATGRLFAIHVQNTLPVAVFVADPEGVTNLAVTPERIAFEPAYGSLIGMFEGGEVRAMTPGGLLVWAATPIGDGVDVVALGDRGLVGMATTDPWWFTTFDAASGQDLGSFGFPLQIQSVSTSTDGSVVTAILPDRLVFFRVDWENF